MGLDPLLLVAGLIALGAVVRWPAASLLVLVIVCQEVSPNSTFGRSAPAQTFGNQLYYWTAGKLSVIELLLAVGAVAALAQSRGSGVGVGNLRRPLLIVGSAGFVVTVIAVLQGLGLLTSLGQYARPFVLTGLAAVVAATTATQRGGWRLASRSALGALALVAGGGALLWLTHLAVPLPDGSFSIFYDSALPALAGSVLLASVLGASWIGGRIPVAAITGVIVLLSGRRNVWLAVAVALVAAMAVRSGRWRLIVQVLAAVLAVASVMYLVAPELLAGSTARLLTGLRTASGSADEVSTSEHMDDLRYGWMYAQQAPALGYGATHDPMPGLAVQKGLLYVHNELLLDWLRFGIPGMLAVGVPAFLGLGLGLRRLRGSTGPELSAALLLVIAPVCAMTAAFYSTTQRWPVLVGFALGALAGGRVSVGKRFDGRVPGAAASRRPDAKMAQSHVN